MRYDLQALRHQSPSSNFALQARLASEYVNQLNELFDSFPQRVTKTTADRWAKRLLEQDFTLHEISSAVDRTIQTCERVPSYAEFLTIIRTTSPRPSVQDEIDAEVEKQAEALRVQTHMRTEAFVNKYSEERLESLVKQWWDGVYGGNPEVYGYPLRVFLPIFFQDLIAARGDIDKAIEIGLETSRQTR